MRMRAIGCLGMAACWSGGGAPRPVSNQASGDGAIAVTQAEDIVARGDSNEVAREQAIEQARAAGILGKAKPPDHREAPPGPLDQESIRREVRAHLKPIRRCYERRLEDGEAVQGTTRVTFVIGADGKVTSSAGSGLDEVVDGCVAGVVKGIRFPAPAGGGTVRVTYPFTFRPPPPEYE